MNDNHDYVHGVYHRNGVPVIASTCYQTSPGFGLTEEFAVTRDGLDFFPIAGRIKIEIEQHGSGWFPCEGERERVIEEFNRRYAQANEIF